MNNVKKYAKILICLIFSIILIFTKLGDAYLWADEAQTAELSANTLEFGYPSVWDGKNLISHSEGDFNSDYVHTATPWLQFYICAASMKLFGKTNFAVRFPFAVLGVISIFMVWRLALLIYRKKSLADFIAIIATLNVPFLLYSRQCRYYALVFFFIITATFFYIRLIKAQSKGGLFLSQLCLALCVCGLLNSNYLFCIIWCCTVLVHIFIVKANFQKLLRVLLPTIVGFLIGLPAIIYLFLGINSVGGVSSISKDVLLRLLTIIWKVQTYFIPFISLSFIIILIHIINSFTRFGIKKKKRKFLFSKYTIFFPILSIMNVLIVALPNFYLMSHYFLSIVVAAPFILCCIIVYIRQYSKVISTIVLVICIGSNFLNIAPYFLIDKEKLSVEPAESQKADMQSIFTSLSGKTYKGLISSPNTTADCLIQPLDKYLNEVAVKSYLLLYLQEITHHFDSPAEGVIDILNKNKSDNENILVCAVEYEYIAFYTNNRIVNRMPFSNNNELNLYPKENLADYKLLVKVPDEKIDWVVLSRYGPVPLLDDNKYLSKNLDKFDKIEVNAPDLYLSNSPDLDVHKFVSEKNTKTPLILLHRKK